MQKIDKTNLKYLGEDFQYKLVKTFIEEPRFFERMESIVDQNMFTENSLKNFVRIMKNYFKERGVTPDYSVINTILGTTHVDEISLQIDREHLEKIKTEVNLVGYDTIKELSEKFFKQQNMIKVANKVLRIVGDGDLDKFEECKLEFEKVVSVTADDDIGVTPTDNIDDILSAESVEYIETGIPELDDVLGGGLDKGKLGLVIGPTGFGKTTLMTAFSFHAAINGKKVLQIIFEDDIIDIRRKYASRCLNVEAFLLKTKPEKGGLTTEQRTLYKEQLLHMPEWEKLKSNIRIKKFSPGMGVTASDIIAFIKKEINMGFIPDMVTIDYFEPVSAERGTSGQSKWEQEGDTMRKFEGAAHELNVAMWIPSQGARDSITASLVTMSMGSGSIQKQQIAQVVMSITRGLEDLSRNTATISVLKNRAGRSGGVFEGIYFDNGTCNVSFSGVKRYDNTLTYKEHQDKVETGITQTYAQNYFRSNSSDDPFS